MLRRLKNLWKLSDIDPDKYSVGFKWTGTIKPQTQDTGIKMQNLATIIDLSAPSNPIDAEIK